MAAGATCGDPRVFCFYSGVSSYFLPANYGPLIFTQSISIKIGSTWSEETDNQVCLERSLYILFREVTTVDILSQLIAFAWNREFVDFFEYLFGPYPFITDYIIFS
jgi:hypothetical protein